MQLKQKLLGWVVLLMLGVLLTACPNTVKNVSVTTTGAGAAAYRVQGGDWQVPDDVENFSFTAGGAYEVAVSCGDKVTVLAFTTADLTAVPVTCEDTISHITFNLNYDASAIAGANSVGFFYLGGMNGSPAGTVSGTLNITNGRAGLQDLVLVAYDNSGQPLAAKMVTQTVSDGGSYTITLAAADAGHLKTGGSVSDFSGQVPSGWSFSSAGVVSVTPHGTVVVDAFLSATGGSYVSYDFANHDAASAMAKDTVAHATKSLSHLQTSTSPAASFTVALPGLFDANISHTALPTFSGLSRSDPDLVGYHLQINWGSNKEISALVSKGFLAANTSYTLPDLTAVPGFAGMKPASGDSVKATAEAIQSNKTWADVAAEGLGGIPTGIAGLDVRIAGDIEEYTAP